MCDHCGLYVVVDGDVVRQVILGPHERDPMKYISIIVLAIIVFINAGCAPPKKYHEGDKLKNKSTGEDGYVITVHGYYLREAWGYNVSIVDTEFRPKTYISKDSCQYDLGAWVDARFFKI